MRVDMILIRMEQLNNKMILLGHKDYPEACAEMDQLISRVA